MASGEPEAERERQAVTGGLERGQRVMCRRAGDSGAVCSETNFGCCGFGRGEKWRRGRIDREGMVKKAQARNGRPGCRQGFAWSCAADSYEGEVRVFREARKSNQRANDWRKGRNLLFPTVNKLCASEVQAG